MGYAQRTRFKKDIVAEFLPPSRPSGKVIVFCSGMPTSPEKVSLLEYYAKKNYWVFAPRYRGTWESSGEFLKESPTKDMRDVVAELQKGKVRSIWDNKTLNIKPKEMFLVGNSFGGPAVMELSRDPRIKKVFAVSPVVDWLDPSEEEPIETFYELVKDGFGEVYRFPKRNWNKLITGKFYNPVAIQDQIVGSKIMIVHARDDRVVHHERVAEFSKATGAQFTLLSQGGHMGTSDLMKPQMSKRLLTFFKE